MLPAPGRLPQSLRAATTYSSGYLSSWTGSRRAVRPAALFCMGCVALVRLYYSNVRV